MEVASEPESEEVLIGGLCEDLQRNSASPRARYHLGTALLLQGGYDDARIHLDSATTATDPLLRQFAYYNSGSSDLSPILEQVAQADREEMLRRAIESYNRRS